MRNTASLRASSLPCIRILYAKILQKLSFHTQEKAPLERGWGSYDAASKYAGVEVNARSLL